MIAKQTREITPGLNVPLLRQVQQAILATPQQFDINAWHCGDVLPGAEDKCGSTACLAGWAVVLGDRIRLSSYYLPQDIPVRARELLRLQDDQSVALFFLHRWPFDLEPIRITRPAERR